jgi:glycosyltransferase involved in cell wall biosynthesis
VPSQQADIGRDDALDPESKRGQALDEAADQPELSAVVLGYRAEGALRPVLESLHRELEGLGEPFELVIVANYHAGSSDSTPEIARDFVRSHPNARMVAQVKQGGMGWDLRSGLEAATGRFLVVIDGDGQNPPSDVPRVYRALRETGCDIVKGRRVTRHDGLHRRILSTAYNLVFALWFGTWRLWDINGKPKGITREAYRRVDLRSNDWFLDAELILEARRLGMAIGEIPVQFRASTSRRSFVRPEAILEFARHMLSYRLRGRP